MDFEVKGQVAIWVILAVVLVASVILFFLLSPNVEILKPAEGEAAFDAQTFLETCSAKYVGEVVELMLPQGGFVNPKNTVFFNNTEIEYVCYNRGFYDSCIQQHPMLLNEMKREIDAYVTPRIDGCFRDMQESFRRRVGDVEYDFGFDVKVDLREDVVILNIDRDTTIEKQGETRRFDGFEVRVSSPAYNLGRIAMEIANQEAKFCYFEFVGYGIINPRYQVKKYTLSQPIDIYTIVDLKSGKEMNIAVRGCALPAAI